MNESFNKFKKKMLFEALIKSISIGLAVGIICFTVPYLINWFLKIEVNPLLPIFLLVGAICIAVIIFGIIFLILYPRKIKVAKRLDKELNLKQKVQTMVEYENVDTPMTKLQREDTLNILANISLKKFAMKFGVFFFAIIVIACTLGVTSIVVASVDDPAETPPIIEEPKYNLDNWTVRALLDLIEVVETSNINNNLKNPVVENLKSLLTSLEEVEFESEMKDLVKKVIDDANLRLDLINTNNEVYTVLKDSKSPLIKEFAVQINALNITNINNCIENIYVYLTGDPATTLTAIEEFDDDFRVVINNSNLNKDEQLTISLLKLANDIKKCEDAANVNESISKAINDSKEIILNIALEQAENKRIIEYTIEQLEIIFGLKENTGGDQTNPDSNQPVINPTEPPKINEGENQGGYGTGEVLFGSNDIMFDIEEGSVEFGEVLPKYYGALVGMFNDGTIPEEYKEFFDKYFDILFGFVKEEAE